MERVCEDSALLAALAYPSASPENLHVAHSLTLLVMLLDDYAESLSVADTIAFVQQASDALRGARQGSERDTLWNQHDLLLSGCCRRFAYTVRNSQSPSSTQNRVIEGVCAYLESLLPEAEYLHNAADDAQRLDMDAYLERRVANIGAESHFAMGQLIHNIQVHIDGDPAVERLEDVVSKMFVLSNDLVSYHKEQSKRDSREKYNALAILTTDGISSLEDAEKEVTRMYLALAHEFMNLYQQLELPRSVNRGVCQWDYIDHLANWPRAQECFNNESGRYL